jgi:hypothetical protein
VRRAVATVALVLALVAGIHEMAELTQNRPDVRVPGSTTTVEFTVSTHDFHRGEPAAATALWAVCSATVGGEVSPVPEAVGDRWLATVSPAIGEHGENRLVGCLEDVTIDRVIGNVTALRTET